MRASTYEKNNFQRVAETIPAAGIVKTHATTMLRATPQRTAERVCKLPTPIMDPVIVCVVDTGMPSSVAVNSAIALDVSAQNPPTGLSFVIFIPMVLTMRQPPNAVPSAITKLQLMTTQHGT